MRSRLFKYVSAFSALMAVACNVQDWWAPVLYKHSEEPDLYVPTLRVFEHLENGDSVRVYCAGTSLTFGTMEGGRSERPWPQVLQEMMAERWPSVVFSVENGGVGGITSEGLLTKLTRTELTQYDLVFIEIGTNDAIHQVDLGKYRANLSQMANLRDSAGQYLVFIAPPPSLCRYAKPLIEYTRVMYEVAKDQGMGFVNMNRRLGEEIEEMAYPSDIMPDCVHLTTPGYAWMAEEVVEWMEGERSTALVRPETSPTEGQ